MNKKLRYGILGCAGIAIKDVMPAIQKSEYGVLAAVASRDLEKSRSVAEQFGITTAYGSYEELIEDATIEAVYIPLPNHLHKEWAIRAMRAGKHVLCEKPIALTSEEAKEMAAVAKQEGVVLAEAFMYRHHPRWKRIREIIESGELGELRLIRGAFTYNNAEDLDNIRLRPEWGGGALYDVGCYPISAARFILGQEPEAITVHAQFSDKHFGVDMMAAGILEFAGGLALTFDCGMWTEHRQLLEIVGSEGRIDIPHAFTVGDDEDASYTVTVRGVSRIEGHEDKADPYTMEVDDLAKAVFGIQPKLFSPDDAVQGMRVLEAGLASARERRRISFK
ncbi:Gfo/Idh/MocA family protein [Paenibacillus lentus]|uniref:Gfo/Idh/MocA family oxidoreductase n=1 Tax=Paenibacillus lentus TaxID=1338368 RepID=A0A3Q8S9Z5_9BACL|nr:Gfo/Idh/MocA family oxidoreductase [Paenibacillus lentus]AZK45789.1 gfo/Idh/MocA family oxidoreductase [Paenibacillus lentus]